MTERIIAGEFREASFIEAHKKFDEWHQREEVSFETRELENVLDAKSRGWSYKRTKEGFIVRAPEQWLVDLTDPYKVAACGDVISNLAYYIFLKGLVKEQKFDSFMRLVAEKNGMQELVVQNLQGPSLETEIRVAGSDTRIADVRKLAFWEAIQRTGWSGIYEQAQTQLSNARPISFEKESLFENNQELAQFYAYIKERLGMVDNARANVFNPDYIPGLFKDVPPFDIYVFIPWGSLRYIPSFLNHENVSKVMFWEIHYDGCQEYTNRFLAKDIEGKQVLIIDNSYSGGTLTRMKGMVANEGGIPSRLALFPKSRLSVQNSEMALVLDTIVKSNAIDIQSSAWTTDLYKNVLTQRQPTFTDGRVNSRGV